MTEKKTDDPIDKLLDDLSSDIKADRDRLSGVLDALITFGKQDPDRMIAIAETVAKIGDSLTKQNHLRVDAIKAISRRSPKGDDERSSPFDDIGNAFSTLETEN